MPIILLLSRFSGLPIIPPEISMLLGSKSELTYFEDEVYPFPEQVMLAHVKIFQFFLSRS